MIKAIALLRRRADLSRAEFISYYETRHAPLIRSLFPEIIAYARNYVDRDGAFDSAVAPIDFDSVTEMRFASRASYDRFLARSAEPAVAKAIADDEENVFDRSATRMMVVDEVPAPPPIGSALPELQAERAVREGLAQFARVIDAKDWGAFGTVFADDLTFDYGLGERAGMAALVDNMRRFLDHCGPTQHLIGSVTVTVEGNGATSRAYVQARHQRVADPAGVVFDSNGEYIDRWELRTEGWRIVRRDALWQVHTGDPAILSAGSADLG
ncbi:nuclear transport factor 2 family protein [Novosphingobium sp.]|uniref:nuclear transport factor 2 family protein n=1 Tax=Novosphingobium sp. TaxID=1874826 RepID=UPI00334243F6